jgi:hypothetical protein
MTSTSHPYQQYEGTALWQAVDHAIDDLVNNGDLIEQTRREYIVGYICKIITERQENRIDD